MSDYQSFSVPSGDMYNVRLPEFLCSLWSNVQCQSTRVSLFLVELCTMSDYQSFSVPSGVMYNVRLPEFMLQICTRFYSVIYTARPQIEIFTLSQYQSFFSDILLLIILLEHQSSPFCLVFARCKYTRVSQ